MGSLIYSNQMITGLGDIAENAQRIYKRVSYDHLSERGVGRGSLIYSYQMITRLGDIAENSQRIYKRVNYDHLSEGGGGLASTATRGSHD